MNCDTKHLQGGKEKHVVKNTQITNPEPIIKRVELSISAQDHLIVMGNWHTKSKENVCGSYEDNLFLQNLSIL